MHAQINSAKANLRNAHPRLKVKAAASHVESLKRSLRKKKPSITRVAALYLCLSLTTLFFRFKAKRQSFASPLRAHPAQEAGLCLPKMHQAKVSRKHSLRDFKERCPRHL